MPGHPTIHGTTSRRVQITRAGRLVGWDQRGFASAGPPFRPAWWACARRLAGPTLHCTHHPNRWFDSAFGKSRQRLFDLRDLPGPEAQRAVAAAREEGAAIGCGAHGVLVALGAGERENV